MSSEQTVTKHPVITNKINPQAIKPIAAMGLPDRYAKELIMPNIA